VGWRIRFAIYLIHALFTIDVLERLDSLNKRLKKEEEARKE